MSRNFVIAGRGVSGMTVDISWVLEPFLELCSNFGISDFIFPWTFVRVVVARVARRGDRG
jgi:hypothetical protein